MDERPGSPEIDVVCESDRSGLFRYRSESYLTSSNRNATDFRAANQNGANRLAANTNKKAEKVETVNLRVRNMGKITVKKEPESDEDCEVSYSLSSLLQECDFEQAPRTKTRALKSPTSLAIAKSKSVEASRPLPGRSRQTLENVISSLKSARSTDTNQPKIAKKVSNFQNPVVPISMPSQIVSVAPTPQSTISFPSSGAVGTGPQIVDVRSLATGAQTALNGAAARSTRSTTSKPVTLRPLPLGAAPNTSHPTTAASNIPVTMAQAAASQVQASTVKTAGSSGPKPLNIRFVLPATEPFNTSEFQQVLQTALASIISQSKGVEASLLQQAIQAALTTVTQASVPLSANQLQQAIQSSLAALSGARPIQQVTPASLTQAPSVRLPQPTQKQPQAIAPMPSRVPSQSAASISTVPGSDKLSTTSPGNVRSQVLGSSTGGQVSSVTPVVSSVTTGPPVVTNANSPIANGGNQLASGVVTSSAAPLNQSPLISARDALIKALQEKRVLNSPPSLSSSSLSSTSEASPSVTVADSIDEPCSVSPPPSPVLSTSEEPAPNSAGPDKSQTPTSAILDTTCTVKTVEQTTTITSTARTPLIVLSSGTYLKLNQSPINSGTQTALISVPLQLQTSQGKSSSATAVTSTFTPQTTTVNLIGQTNAAVQSTAPSMPASKTPPVILPTQLLQVSLVPATSSNTPVAKPDIKPTAAKTKTASVSFCGGGCCKYCRACHENNNVCGLPTCQKAYPNRAALRKHYYFNPTHKAPIPMEKASTACDNFLPLELADSHRRARLRELFRRLPDDEFQELIKPRMAKLISLFQLLEQKSQRVQSGGISAFKMFTEFERFRKEVEANLLQLILLPQGKDQTKVSKNSSKDGSKPVDAKTSDTNHSSQAGQTTAKADKQDGKDSLSSGIASADQKLESSTAQPKTDANPSVGSSEMAKKTVDTICIDSDVEMSTTKTSDTGAGLANQDVPSAGAIDNGAITVEDKKAGDSSSVEEKSAESGKESGDVASTSSVSPTVSPGESPPSKDGQGKEGEKKEGELLKQSSSLPQSLEASESTTSSDSKLRGDQPPEHPKQTEISGHISGDSTPRETTSVPMEIDDSSKVLKSQSSDVLMVDDQNETKSCSNDGELKSRKEEQTENIEKPMNLASNENKTAVDHDALAEKDSEAAGKDVSESSDATQEDKMAEKPSDGEKHIAAMDVEEAGNISKTSIEKGQAKDATVEKIDKVGNKVDGAKLNSDENGTVKDGDQTEKSKNDPEKRVKEGQQKETMKNKAEGACEGRKVETRDVDGGSDITTGSTIKQTPEVSMLTDKAEGDVSKDQVGKDANKEKTSLEKDSDEVKEVPMSRNEDGETNAESTEEKGSQERCDAGSKGKESAKASSSQAASSSSNTLGSSDATSAGSSNSTMQTGSDTAKVKKKLITLEDLDLGDEEEGEDEMDENNLLDFSLPFAIKWGRIIKKVRLVEAKKIARKENYSEQDMKQFIYNKPKDAANAVIIADCHAHPSFFRAYVMPALLDKHIDDFGLFGKKLLSRLVLPRRKYVQILRNGIGPELAKILGINIFPTFKRIQDTWISIKNPLGTTSRSSYSKTVIAIDAADDVEVPDEETEAAPAEKAAEPTNTNSQNAADKARDSLKRPGPTDGMENDNNKKQRVDNAGNLDL